MASPSPAAPNTSPWGGRIRLIIALVVVALSVFISLDSTPKLGLDLRGGTQITLETRDSPTVEADAEATDRTLEVLRGRVDALGVAEPTLARAGENRILVELPGLQDPREAAEVIGRTAQLSFHPVTGTGPGRERDGNRQNNRENTQNDPQQERELVDEDGAPLTIGPAAVQGDEVSSSDPGNDPATGTGWFVTVDFKGQGGQAWKELTAEAACAGPGDPRRRVAIVLDDQVISSPQVAEDVGCGAGISGGSTQITGDFSAEEARELSILIEGGALPVPVEIVEQRTVGPTLGEAAIDASVKAAIIGLALTGLFIIVTYRLMGLLATIALVAYAGLSYAALTAIGATLTLPGLAGFVLAIGMAIDANVLVFERAREEYAEKASLPRAVHLGYTKAWTAILDSNVTTLLAAGLLFFLASGPVKGFGVTLSIGVIASMVSALVIARAMTELASRSRWLRRHPSFSGLSSTGRVRQWLVAKNPDIMGRSRMWLAGSALALLAAVAGIVVNGVNWGVEFTGGRSMEYSTAQPLDADTARDAVSDAGFPTAVVNTTGEGNVSVRAGQLSNDDEVTIREALAAEAGGATKERDELIGPSLGDELRLKALIALGVALAAQMLYLAVRFKWTIAASAVLAMFHDVVLVTGVFAWLGKPIDGLYLAAALTIIGLSVNDSVVVFDRVREIWGSRKTESYATAANDAVLSTMPRTVNTGLGAMFILAALVFLGGDSLTDFALALLLGLVVGTYSSVFTAAPLSVELHHRWPMSRAVASGRTAGAPPRREPTDSGAVI
jgi:SecD/SecF fusion protein